MPKLQHILMLTHGLGSCRRARGYAPHLVARGYKVRVVTISERNRFHGAAEESRGVRIIQSPDLLWGRLRTGWDAWDCAWRIVRLLRDPVDLIVCFDTRPVSVIPAFALKHILKVPVVMNWGDWWGRGGTIAERSRGVTHALEQLFAPVETFFEERFHRYADGVIVLSSALRDRGIGLGVPANKIRIIVPGVDAERIRPGDRHAARQALGLSAHGFLYGFAGRLFPRDADLLLEAHRRVASQIPHATAVLIGNTKYQLPGGAPENVISTGGNLPDHVLLQWFAACDALLLPLSDSIANRGRWPFKAGEYMAAARPVVATAVGDVAGLFADGAAGVLTDANPIAFADGILKLYADPRRAQMGSSGREIVRNRLIWPLQTDVLQEFLEQVYERRQNPDFSSVHATDSCGRAEKAG